MKNIHDSIEKLARFKTNMFQGDFLLTWEKSQDEILSTLSIAELLKHLYEKRVSLKVFRSGLAVSIFRDQSTRTRFSFASASNLLGLEVTDMDETKSQIVHGETVRETTNMISFLTEAIGIRDDIFLGAGNAYMREVSSALEDGFRNGVLAQRPGIVNLQCDIDHPTQSMADLLHLKNQFGSLENLKGKKIAISWAYSPSYGKPLSVPQGLIGLMTRFGMEVHLAFPEGYDLLPECTEIAGKNAEQSGGKFRFTHSMEQAFEDAHVVYPKSWAPFQVMKKRTEFLKSGKTTELKDLEKECLSNNARFKNWECTEAKMKLTEGGKALYMHCLPADISSVSCDHGEVENSVFERYRLKTYFEASYKPFIIASMIWHSRFKSPIETLKAVLNRNEVRSGF